MSDKIDFARINDAALACLESLCCELLPGGHKEGPEYKAADSTGGQGKSFSVNLHKGVWKDFAGDVGGSDPISLVAAIRDCKMGEAAIWLNERIHAGGLTQTAPTEYAAGADPSKWTPQPCAPSSAPAPNFNHYRLGQPSRRWEYKTATGKTVGWVCRFDLSDGGKDVIPVTWCRNEETGVESWRWKAFAQPRPLYGLPELLERPNVGVLVVEGEKTKDAAQRLCPSLAVVTWPGGSKAVKLSDFSVLAGRSVLIWPDADAKTYPEKHEKAGRFFPLEAQPGFKAALKIQGIISEITKSCRVIRPQNLPPNFDAVKDGWDLADAEQDGWTCPQVIEFIKRDKAAQTEPQPEHEPDAADLREPSQEKPVIDVHAQPEIPGAPFRLLGHDVDKYYYLPDGKKQVVELSASEHKSLNLLKLAPLQFWECTYPGDKGVDWQAAANALIQLTHDRGLFSVDKIRGRGCWIDSSHVVFHAGNYLVVDGHEVAIQDFKSEFIYELGHRLEIDNALPAVNKEAVFLRTLCESLSWKYKLDGLFLAGWLVVAPICGALAWRPHIWLTGPSGSGKSWIQSNIIQPMLGNVVLQVQSVTTEAGIRQTLRSDALPVTFDEAESQDQRGRNRMDGVLELSRQASSESGAPILKGTAGGNAMAFHIRSCFAFSSIGVASVNRADTSRVTIVELVKPDEYQAIRLFEHIKELWADTILKPGFCARLRARALSLAPTIRANAITFAAVIGRKLGDQRTGDQLGALLAGAFSLTSSGVIDVISAKKWVDEQDWSAWTPEAPDMDENKALAVLADAHIRIDGAQTRTVGELIEEAFMPGIDPQEAPKIEAARTMLVRNGIRCMDGFVVISNSHHQIARIFADTPYGGKWKDQLGRIKGAEQRKAVRFLGASHRAVAVPVGAFLDEGNYEEGGD